MTKPVLQRDRPFFEGPEASIWFVATARILFLLVVATGAYLTAEFDLTSALCLGAFYVFGLGSGLWHIIYLRRSRRPLRPLTWGQVLADFGVVAATVGFTGSAWNLLASLFVIVILEAGLLLGPRAAYFFSTLSLLASLWYHQPPLSLHRIDITVVYTFLTQGLAYYLTASISAYWNQRMTRMQQFQREILDNMNNGFLICDPHGVILAQNKAGDRILGLGENLAVGRAVQEVLRPETGAECPVLTALRLQRDFTRYEFPARTTSGQAILLGLSTSLLQDGRGCLRGIIAAFSDLTEIAQLREELQLQDRMAAVGELAAGLAHEIRNPLAALRGAVEELKSNLSAPAMAERLSTLAIRESDHLNRIVSDFLDFARSPSVRRETFDLRILIENVTESFRHAHVLTENLRIRNVLPDRTCAVSGDPSQLKQVLVNLCKNAVEAMGEQGSLMLILAPGAGFAEFRVEDDGPGIDPDKVARIFEPFYTTKESGVGMGLAVCQRIITAHDGTIRVTARAGGGTSVIVRLPLARTEE